MAYVYAETKTQKDRELYSLQQTFLMQYRTSNEGKDVTINNTKELHKAIVKDHSNPLNVGIKDDDKRIMVLGNVIKCGDEVTLPDYDMPFLTVTNPSYNGVYSECKIRKLQHDISFAIDGIGYTYRCDTDDGLSYEDSSSKNERKVFAEDENVAIILRANYITSQIELFDYVSMGNKHYKVAEIDNTLTGCIQFVLYECFEDEVFSVDGVEFKGLGRYGRVKDYNLNSISTKLSVPFKTIKQGDIVYHSYKYPDGTIENKKYITVSNENQNVNCDEFLLYECMNEITLADKDGNIKSIPYYYENNRYRGKELNNDNTNQEKSEYELTMPYNSFTKLLNKEINRVLIHIQDDDIRAYSVYGVELLQKGLIRVSLNNDKVDTNNDLIDHVNGIYIADYYSNNTPNPSGEIKGDSEIIIGEENVYTSTSNNIWDISDSSLATIISQTNNECIVTAIKNFSNIGKKFILSHGLEEKEITVVNW